MIVEKEGLSAAMGTQDRGRVGCGSLSRCGKSDDTGVDARSNIHCLTNLSDATEPQLASLWLRQELAVRVSAEGSIRQI